MCKLICLLREILLDLDGWWRGPQPRPRRNLHAVRCDRTGQPCRPDNRGCGWSIGRRADCTRQTRGYHQDRQRPRHGVSLPGLPCVARGRCGPFHTPAGLNPMPPNRSGEWTSCRIGRTLRTAIGPKASQLKETLRPRMADRIVTSIRLANYSSGPNIESATLPWTHTRSSTGTPCSSVVCPKEDRSRSGMRKNPTTAPNANRTKRHCIWRFCVPSCGAPHTG